MEEMEWNILNYMVFDKNKENIMYKRGCPECGRSISYKDKISSEKADRNKTLCKSCCHLGSRNGFYGKKHKKATVEKLSNISSMQVRSEKSKKSQSIKMSGSKNSMYGKSLYEHWVNRYGEKEANRKYKKMVSKQSKNTKGKKNPMYGKPSPQGSGNGWSGWYKGWYFRSLRELSYMINKIEKNNWEWVSAESKKFAIPYKDWNGTSRNYFPDFFINDKVLTEIKPVRLKNALTNSLKREAAQKFCKKNGYEYKEVDPKKLTDDDIINLYRSDLIKFIDRYDKMFKERYL